MKIGEVISRLDENQIYNIIEISSSLVGCDGSSLLIHGVADLHEHWDKISCAVASFVFPCTHLFHCRFRYLQMLLI